MYSILRQWHILIYNWNIMLLNLKIKKIKIVNHHENLAKMIFVK